VSLVGIIANPASGKDIRRLVAHGSTFDNNEKINIVRRALLGLEAAGVERVAYLPDTYAIVARAAAPTGRSRRRGDRHPRRRRHQPGRRQGLR
jgi:predicted polyphosphate/ATP-dependent NAD kinase